MHISTNIGTYEMYFYHAQVEITGYCNMHCQHCRAAAEPDIHMSATSFQKILDFSAANSENISRFALTISGGEPFLHPQLIDFVKMTKKAGIEDAIITTNGSVVSDKMLRDLDRIGMRNLGIQVSVDSTDPLKHDAFRGFPGAHAKAIDTLKRVSQTNMAASLKATITPDTLHEIDELVHLAKSTGAVRIGMGTVIPSGKGKDNVHLVLSRQQKKEFLEKLTDWKKNSRNMDFTTEDPLKFATRDAVWDFGGGDIQDPCFFGGCSAGSTSFNVNSEGIMTPCAVLFKPIVNFNQMSLSELREAYETSPVIRSLVAREFKDNCGICSIKRLCGGCRAVAEGVYGDYLAGDPTCFRHEIKREMPALQKACG